MKTWNGLHGREVETMHEKDAEVFLSISLQRGAAVLLDCWNKLRDNEFPAKVLASRFDESKCEPGVKIFVVLLTKTVGQAVMWAYTLEYLRHRRQADMYTWDMFVLDFPMGFPTDKALDEAWDEQKGYRQGVENVDNCLDHSWFWNFSGEVTPPIKETINEDR